MKALIMSVKYLVTSVVTAMLLVPGAVQAAAINWSTGPTFNGASGFLGILTNGTLIEAINTGSTGGPLTVDPTGLNITFTALDSLYFPNMFFSGSPGSTDAAWNSIIDTSEFQQFSFNASGFLSGLTSGNSYQIQLFASDARDCCSSRASRFGDGLPRNFSEAVTHGSFISIVGVFTANAADQDIAFSVVFDSFNLDSPILGAYVLRQTAPTDPIPRPIGVPEPVTLGLLGAGLAGVGVMRRCK